MVMKELRVLVVFFIASHFTAGSFVFQSHSTKMHNSSLKSTELDELAQALQRGNTANPLDQFTNAYKKKESPKWFEAMDKLPFECTECGKCCQTKGEVFLNPSETKGASDVLGISVDEFKALYVARVEEFPSKREPVGWTVLKQKETNDVTECIFLKDNKCEIYGSRPLQCSTYPFWPRFMDDVDEWNDEVVDELFEREWSYENGGCEGMKRVDIASSPEIKEGVSLSEATEKLNMYTRYKKQFPLNFVNVGEHIN